MAKKWKKIEMSPTWNFEEEKELVGVYKGKEEDVGPNGSNLYHFEKEDNSNIAVWGNTALDQKLKYLEPGVEVKMVYLGLATSEKSGREYHNFEIYEGEA